MGPTLEVGATIGRYEIVRFLGAGGMGEVYEARHLGLKKPVAIKVLSHHLVNDERSLRRFLREGEAASRVKHPHVVDVTDVGVEEGRAYLVMELLEGRDLAQLLASGPLPLRELADILVPVIAGVEAAHRSQIIHRDLKPENIFLCRDEIHGWRPVVLDFGVSKMVDDPGALALTGSAALVGTPYYISPEQARGAKDVDGRADQYALGVILYESLTGRRPYESDSLFELIQAITSADFPRLRELRPDLPEELARIVDRAMAVRREERFPSLAHLGSALLSFASEETRRRWEPVLERSMRSSADTLAGAMPDLDLDRRAARATTGEEPTVDATSPTLASGAGAAPEPTPSPVSAAESRARPVRRRARAIVSVGAAAVLIGAVVALLAIGPGAPEPAARLASAGHAAEPSPTAAAAPSAPATAEPLRFAVSPFLSEDTISRRYDVLVDYLAATMDREVEVVSSDRFDDVSSALIAGEADLGMVSSFWYVRTGRRGGVKLLAVAQTSSGRTYYEGVVITRAGSGPRSLQGLDDRVFCYVTPGSTSGYLYPRAVLRQAGLDPDDSFRTTRFAGGHIEAMQLVDDGVCDAAAVAKYILERDWPRQGDAEDFRVIAETGRIPYDAVAASGALPSAVVARLREALLDLAPGSDRAHQVLGEDSVIQGYVAIEDSAYSAVRGLDEHLEAGEVQQR